MSTQNAAAAALLSFKYPIIYGLFNVQRMEVVFEMGTFSSTYFVGKEAKFRNIVSYWSIPKKAKEKKQTVIRRKNFKIVQWPHKVAQTAVSFKKC